MNNNPTASSTLHILFGGSFDPVHEGHLATADTLRKQLHAHTLTLLPAARSPLKPAATPDRHRLAMLRCALQDYPGLVIDERELHRPPPSYTIDTLRDVRSGIGTAVPLVWVVGSDALAGLPQWKEWQSLTSLAHLLVVDRPDSAWPAQGPVADWLATSHRATSSDQLQCCASGYWLRMTLPPQPFSSTDIRTRLASRQRDTARPEGLPACVWQYILEHDLYLPDRKNDTR